MYITNVLLKRHVLESNLIEGIRAYPGRALYQSHFFAAHRVAHEPSWRIPLHPLEIHRILSRGTDLESHGGSYRSCGVSVGGYRMPFHKQIPELMEWWWKFVTQYHAADVISKTDSERLALLLHDLFLCIHPFQDGNGRTARLVLNALRLKHGLPWLVIEANKKYRYYGHIVATQERVFRIERPDAYRGPA